jgi:hypothetical protein
LNPELTKYNRADILLLVAPKLPSNPKSTTVNRRYIPPKANARPKTYSPRDLFLSIDRYTNKDNRIKKSGDANVEIRMKKSANNNMFPKKIPGLLLLINVSIVKNAIKGK